MLKQPPIKQQPVTAKARSDGRVEVSVTKLGKQTKVIISQTDAAMVASALLVEASKAQAQANLPYILPGDPGSTYPIVGPSGVGVIAHPLMGNEQSAVLILQFGGAFLGTEIARSTLEEVAGRVPSAHDALKPSGAQH